MTKLKELPMVNTKYLILSDLHIGHNKNPADRMYNSLVGFFKDHEKKINSIDYLFLLGDTYHKLLTHSGDDKHYMTSIGYLSFILNYCKRYKIKVRGLEGTPYHDRRQLKGVHKLIEGVSDIDFIYVDKIDVIVESDGLVVGYIPDEMNESDEDTYSEIKNIMKDKGVTKMDILLIHGSFEHQLPFNSDKHHRLSRYENLVTYYIHSGHIHTYSHLKGGNGVVHICNGSFDRISHGEEEDKGGVLAQINSITGAKWDFLINRYAMAFKTIAVNAIGLDEAISEVLSKVRALKEPSNIRVQLSDESHLYKNMSRLKEVISGHTFVFDVKRKTIDKDVVVRRETVVTHINESNLWDMLRDRLSKSDCDLPLCKTEIETLKEKKK